MRPDPQPKALLHQWLTQPLDADVRQVIERWRRLPDVAQIALMPDVHLGEASCIGVALATSRMIYLDAIGRDIGCGISALAFDAAAQDTLRSGRGEKLLAALAEAVPIIRHGRRFRVPCLELSLERLSDRRLAKRIRHDALTELGTLGRGNHFVELQECSDGRLWLMVHTGSRAAGQIVFDFYASLARSVSPGTPAIDATSDAGRDCAADLAWATEFAAENRERIVEAVARALKRELGVRPDAASHVDVSHNFLAQERVNAQDVLVHRKGAAPAHVGQPGLIPGSMGTATYHVVGRGVPESLFSSSHGAGRVMSRSDASRRVSHADLGRQMQGVIHDATKASGLLDEAPCAYKDIDAVMRAQRDLVTIQRRLRPRLSFKGV